MRNVSCRDVITASFLLTSAFVPLAACGSSSSGGSSGISQSDLLQMAAGSRPRAGSVTQGSRIGSDDITSDIVHVDEAAGIDGVIVSINVGGEAVAGRTNLPAVSGAMRVSARVRSDGSIEPNPDIDGSSDDRVNYTLRLQFAAGTDDADNGRRTEGWNYRTRYVGPSRTERDAREAACTSAAACEAAYDGAVLDYGAQFVDWTTDADNYMAGGIWFYTYLDGNNAEQSAWGAFTDGDETLVAQIPTTGTATYNGHSYGLAVVGATDLGTDVNAIDFTASASLTATFTTGASREVTGTIDNFFMSGSGNFAEDGVSPSGTGVDAEDRLSISVNLQAAPLAASTNFFEGITAGTVTSEGTNTAPNATLAGRWGGAFFGAATGAPGTEPPYVGGTWGAHGTYAGDPVIFNGSFGAARDGEASD